MDIIVQVRSDHIASMASAAPLSAIEELVWNALDADARNVTVDLITNALGGLDAVRISDDGLGIDYSTIDGTFGSLGGSWKRDGGESKAYSRKLHGKLGRGRFKAFAIGMNVQWRTTCAKADGTGLTSYTISGDALEPGVFHVAETSPGPATGTEVFIDNIKANASSLLNHEACVQTLAAKFALYLKAYPKVSIYYCGLPITPIIVQKAVTEYPIRTSFDESAHLEVIEWKRKFTGTGKLVFAGTDGFALYETAPGVRPGAAYSYTAYLVSPRLKELAENGSLLMEELHPEVRAYLDEVKKMLRDHFNVIAAQEQRSRVAQWIDEKIYPFGEGDQSSMRKRFDVAVHEMRSHIEGFDAMNLGERAYIFGLLLKSVQE